MLMSDSWEPSSTGVMDMDSARLDQGAARGALSGAARGLLKNAQTLPTILYAKNRTWITSSYVARLRRTKAAVKMDPRAAWSQVQFEVASP